MKILLADDAEVVRMLIGRFVELLGHQVIFASDGLEAIERFVAHQPDMVLMDMMMPRMDGPGAARQIKASSPDRWVPVVLVTAVGEEAKLAEAIETGADDYLVKPVNYRILEAKIKAIERTVGLHREVRAQSAMLAEYYDRAEEEKRIARHLLDQMVNRERLFDPQLHYWISAAESLSGDLIAAARTPGGVLHLLLADGIGHGLNAALNVLPLTQPFYAMTERGFEPADILREMHAKVRQVLPVGRFVAVGFVAVDFASRQIEVWNGGLPPIYLLDTQGQPTEVWPSSHLPVGILEPEVFDCTTTCTRFDARATLLICSDGLLEARNAQGEVFGSERLHAAFRGVTPAQALEGLKTSFQTFLGGRAAHDDVSVALVELDPSLASDWMHAPPPKPLTTTSLGPRVWRQGLCLGPAELRSLRVVPLLMSVLAEVHGLAEVHRDVFLILQEMFNEALERGLLGIDESVMFRNPASRRALRDARLSALQSGALEIEVAGHREGEGMALAMMVAIRADASAAKPRFAPNLARVQALCQSVEVSADLAMVRAVYVPVRH
jgi:CheY-like chemotaxis protein